MRELTSLAELARPALLQALTGTPSVETRERVEQILAKLDAPITDGETLRRLRAVEVLAQIGTPEARRFLQPLAGGAPEARLTQDAKVCLERLSR
jgi:hypothetical protein